MAKQKPGCPVCKAGESADYAPFCSRRCADIDLGRWLNADYQLPGQETASPEDIVVALQDKTDQGQ